MGLCRRDKTVLPAAERCSSCPEILSQGHLVDDAFLSGLLSELGCYGCRRNEIALCARLLGVSAHALNCNPGLILLVVVTKIVMTLAILPIFAFMFLAYTNGHIARNGVHSAF